MTLTSVLCSDEHLSTCFACWQRTMKLHGITQFEKSCTGLLGLVVQHYRAGVRLKRRMGRLLLALLVLPFGRLFALLDVLLVIGFSNTFGRHVFGRFSFNGPKGRRR